MTNEQTAVLLRSIALQSRKLAQDVKVLIVDGSRESERHWIGEGEKPDPPLIPDLSFSYSDESKKHPYYQSKNWEERPTGEFLAVREIELFTAWLEEQAETLVSQAAG